jgi:hypothetical protein
MQNTYKRVICKSGFSMSVQAHVGAYCSPRSNNAKSYTHVEVGFPSTAEPMLMDWCDDPTDPMGTVYGYVPVQVITNVIAKHGGMVEGTAPPGVIQLWSD